MLVSFGITLTLTLDKKPTIRQFCQTLDKRSIHSWSYSILGALLGTLQAHKCPLLPRAMAHLSYIFTGGSYWQYFQVSICAMPFSG